MFQYYSSSELKIINKFEKDGFLIFDIDKIKIKKIRNIVNNQIFKLFKKKNIKIKKQHRSDILNKFHLYIKNSELNQFRLNIYNYLNNDKKFLETYFKISKKQLEIICGNELAMQRKVNLARSFLTPT